MNTLADRIRESRAAAGLDPAELARRIGVKAAAAYQWESGATKSLKAETAIALAEELGVDVAWLVLGRRPREKAAPLSQSQPMQLDPAKLAETHKALRERFEKVGGYNIETNPEAFAAAYSIRAGLEDAYDSPDVFRLVIEHADLTPQGAMRDGRSNGMPPEGGAERAMGRGRRR